MKRNIIARLKEMLSMKWGSRKTRLPEHRRDLGSGHPARQRTGPLSKKACLTIQRSTILDQRASMRSKGILGRLRKKIDKSKHNMNTGIGPSQPKRQPEHDPRPQHPQHKFKQEWTKIGTSDPKGLKEINKRTRIENWATKQGVKILGLAGTQHEHCSKEGGTTRINLDNVKKKGEYRWYFSSSIDPQKHDKKHRRKREREMQ